jgi:hypothetical protein
MTPPPTTSPPTPISPVPLGILLAMLNTAVIGVGMAINGGELGIAVWVFMFGLVPAVILGALLGWLAEVMQPLSIWVRRVVLIVPAVLLVVGLGDFFALRDFIVVSCIPTAVATLMLERGTRLVVVPPVPLAHARATK